MNTVSAKRVKLVTFAVSHFCEKARWALDFWGVAWFEEAHAPFFHRSHSNNSSVPVLFVDERADDAKPLCVFGSDDIATFAHAHATRNAHIGVPVSEHFIELNTATSDLGVLSRRLAYFHILQDRALALDQLAPEGIVPARERWYLSWGMIALIPLMRLGMDISADSGRAAIDAIDAILTRVETQLQHSAYLSGGSFGLLDMNFCALASPLVLPPQHAYYDALYRRLGPDHAFTQLVQQYRMRPAGQFVLQCYASHRNT